ncbi:unnamed protein product [Coffea canephora]|uniref:phosphopyruvate hydratase n=1 Tax=Coffea canephora TaxID=49390 RepID=A0A068UTI0_COFCA|nr:unnamed protein product [Coffea canephora]
MCFCCFDICLFIADLFLQSVIKKKYGQDATNVGDEGDIALISRRTRKVLNCLKQLLLKLVTLVKLHPSLGVYKFLLTQSLRLQQTNLVQQICCTEKGNNEERAFRLEVVIGMDVAASEFYGKDKTYDLNFKEENNDGSQKISGYD